MNKTEALAYIKTEYARLDKITGVDTSFIQVKLSSRLTRKLGYFAVKKKNVFSKPELSITISDKIIDSPEIFIDVIRHEYAHAVVYLRYPRQSHGHDSVWKSVCKEVGCIPKATRKDPGFTQTKTRPYKYIVKCSVCGAESRYKTESKVVKLAMGKIPGTVICKRCGSRKFAVKKL